MSCLRRGVRRSGVGASPARLGEAFFEFGELAWWGAHDQPAGVLCLLSSGEVPVCDPFVDGAEGAAEVGGEVAQPPLVFPGASAGSTGRGPVWGGSGLPLRWGTCATTRRRTGSSPRAERKPSRLS